MRILHTSDWHLGQYFFTQSRLEEHRLFIDWLLDTIKNEQIDVVIIAGDVFDTASPPSYARELYHQFVVKAYTLNCQLVIVGGNHDSVAVLNESKQVLHCLNTHVVASVDGDLSAQLLELPNKRGETGALVCAVPFLRPRDLLSTQVGKDEKLRRQELSQAISTHYHSLFQLAQQHSAYIEHGVPIIGTGHLTALGITQSDSERDIYIGTLEGFSASQFPAFDYLALGHIHRAQMIGGNPKYRYSGSPLALSFNESSTQKSLVMVDLAQPEQEPRLITIPVFRPLISLEGEIEQLAQAIEALTWEKAQLPPWLSISIASNQHYSDVQQRIQDLLQESEMEVLQIVRRRSESSYSINIESPTLAETEPEQVFAQRLQSEMEHESSVDEQKRSRMMELFKQMLIDVQSQESQA